MKHILKPSKILVVLSFLGLSAATALAAPTIEVKEGATTLVSGTPSSPFPTTAVGSSSVATTFTVKNTGTTGVDLTLSVATATGNAADFVVSTLGSPSLGYGATTTFTVTFSPKSNGSRVTVLRITNNASGSNPFDISLTGVGQAPMIAIYQPVGTPFANNSDANFGDTATGQASDLTFTVKNDGGLPLNLSSFTFGGAGSRDFSFVGATPNVVPANSSADFTVRFFPSATVVSTADLTVANNSATSSYNINLKGTGVKSTAPVDAFGYECTEIAGGNILPFLVATDAGVMTEATLTGVSKSVPLDIGFDFFFYEKAYSRCFLSTAGLITFDAPRVDLPKTDYDDSSPTNFIAPLWTDLEVTSSSKILYKTIGTAPDRIFVVKYEKVKLYNNGAASTDKRITFQVQLYETTNAVQIRYQDEDSAVASPAQQATIGIRSRKYTGDPQPGAGAVAVQYKSGLFNVAANRPFASGTTARSILFTRPVVITVESKYARPVPTDKDPNATKAFDIGILTRNDEKGLISITADKAVAAGNPIRGTIYGTARGTNKRFEAPQFIYLDKDFNQLASVGEVNDPNPAWYRLVNKGFSTGEVSKGTDTYLTSDCKVDVTVVWTWSLEYAAIIESGKPAINGSVGAVNGGGRQWLKPGDQFKAVLDNPLEGLNDASGYRLQVQAYSLFDTSGTQIGSEIPVTAGAYVTSNPLSMTAPIRLRWKWIPQVRYLFDARSSGISSNVLNDQSFLRTYKFDGTLDSTYFGSGPDMPVWVNIGTKVEVGAFYRTTDRRLTLADFQGAPSGDLTPNGRFISGLKDSTAVSFQGVSTPRVSRIYTVPSARTPTDIHWLYAPTVFRAEIPLGQNFDPSSPDAQLVPDLATGANLKLVGNGPDSDIKTQIYSEEGSILSGTPMRWDTVGKLLYPVQPGSHRVTWPDADGSGNNYIIEIVTAFPGDSAALTFPRENEDGTRRLLPGQLPPNFVMNTPALAGVASDFPAAPVAHYRHLYDAVADRRPPTKLDLSATDEWAFQELPFAERATGATATKTASGVPFNTSGTGRSVLLYSVRPDADEIADGSLDKEKLAVRIVQSSPVSVITRNDPKLVLGRHALVLGSGSTPGGAYGVVQTGATPATTSVDPGNKFVVDFWLNAKGLKSPAAITLANGETTIGSTTLRCASAASVVPGMGISGTNIPAGTKIVKITGETLVLSNAATASGTGLSLSATNKPVTVVTTDGGRFKVTLDPEAATATATYRGIQVSHPLPKSGAAWRHYAVHVFTSTFFKVNVTVVDFYLDGVRQEQGFVTNWLPAGSANSSVIDVLTDNSLRFGVDAEARSGLQLDNFRIFNLGADPLEYLNPSEILRLRSERDMTVVGKQLRNVRPLVSFDFETAPTSGLFANQGTLANVGVGKVSGLGTYPGIWANVDLQEVATRIESTLDKAAFGGCGYVLNAVSNYNSNLYTRSAEIGTWGSIFPVNHNRLFTEPTRKLEVAYYENPYLTDRLSNPNVAWPYVATEYNDVVYPELGPHKNKAIYIASRIGSEGVDTQGYPQTVFDSATYADLKIYNQPIKTAAGYNPNEEHALTAPAGRAALKVKNLGENVPNSPPLAAFALQCDVNVTGTSYTSDPWVLVQVTNLVTGEPEMAAYQVFTTRVGTVAFPRPRDLEIANASGLAYQSAANPEDRFLTMDPAGTYDFCYAFSFPVYAGDLLVPPYPLNLVIGNTAMPDATGGNDEAKRTLWKDVNKNAWVVSGGGTFFYQFFYPYRSDFYLPGATPLLGTPVAWVPDNKNGVRKFTSTAADKAEDTAPGKVVYTSFWRNSYPKLKRGETLTYQGGEYFNENPGSKALPALVAMKAAEIVFDDASPTMILNDTNVDNYSARILRPLDRYEVGFTVAQMAAAQFTPASPDVMIVAERWYFKKLAGSLQKRFYFDSLAEKLVFRGYLNGKDSGDPDLTAGPDPLNILEPNVATTEDRSAMGAVGAGPAWAAAVEELFQKSQNPMQIRTNTPPNFPEIKDRFLAGLKESPVVTERIGVNMKLFAWVTGTEAYRAELQRKLVVEQARVTALSAEIRKLEQLRSTINVPGFFNRFEGLISAINNERKSINLTKIREEISNCGYLITHVTRNYAAFEYSPLDSFGVGAALVPNPALLTAPVNGSRFITIAENNRSELGGAPISLHIIEIVPDRYRGAIKVIEGMDAFSEKITLQHNGEFGANTGDLYYEWWIRDAAPLDVVAKEVLADGTLKQTDAYGQSLWQQYLPKARVENNGLSDFQKHLGLHTIVFEGRPDIVLADKLVLMRYRHKNETNGWKLVPFEFTNPATEWRPGSASITAPFQWAGAANSPQLQADGSKRYIPQLIMGWVKRVLDRINPYEARYADFFSNETPATYSSQIQIAGAPYAGKVALNSDKNVIENTGLIELYRTILERAKELSIGNSSNGNATDGINQALLLAATRLSTLYELLGSEAYSDAQDSTINAGEDSSLAGVASYTHAFQNMEADLQHEELALLRGTDFGKSYPVYNRMFWNYAKGLGEAAYNVNYNIYDANSDGFINEDDARKLYPQGHGDAWGHYVSALDMHYTLLQHPGFTWRTRSELYSLMQNVLEVDYLDEKTFARLAAGRARSGRDIVRNTYRLGYTQNPDGQWQGYTDGADPARAWGVSEWAHRAGQASHFDWAVANALLPAEAAAATPVTNPENLDRIERSGAIDEVGAIAAGLHEIQVAMDEANSGVNPLGLDSDALAFDIELQFYNNSSGGDRRSHFEQIYSRAIDASANALTTLDMATQSGNKLRSLADDTEGLIQEAMAQDLDFRNRLIEIFGRPYDGTIGVGKAYPEGYLGPDTLLYAYLDKTKIDQIVPPKNPPVGTTGTVTFDLTNASVIGIMNKPTMTSLYSSVWGGNSTTRRQKAFETLIGNNNYQFEPLDPDGAGPRSAPSFTAPYMAASKYALQADPGWGTRTSYGRVQASLQDMLADEIELDSAIADYIGYLGDLENRLHRLESELQLYDNKEGLRDKITATRASINALIVAADVSIGIAEAVSNAIKPTAEGIAKSLPLSIGFSNDVTSIARGMAYVAAAAAGGVFNATKAVKDLAKQVLELARDETIELRGREIERVDQIRELEGMIEEFQSMAGNEQSKRNSIGAALQNLEVHRQGYITAQAEGFRILREREAFNKILAAKVQKNRYQDMVFRLSRNEAMSKYQSSFNAAARYAWMAVRAYDYETSLDPGHPAAPGTLLDQIVKERQLGAWVDGAPQQGHGGLAEILARTKGNFDVFKGQLGINNPQEQNEKISLRSELFRIHTLDSELSDAQELLENVTKLKIPESQFTIAQRLQIAKLEEPENKAALEQGPASDDRWKDALKSRMVPDLNKLPEFVRHCRPFATGVQPGLVIRFSTSIEPGKNFFGHPLTAGDHSYGTANYATKIQGVGVWMDNYNAAGLAISPRAFLVPVGTDYLRTSSSTQPITRAWNIVEQRIPAPYLINASHISSPDYIPTLNGIDGSFSDLRRYGDFRMYHDNGDPEADESELIMDSRLISRSVWNSQWLLIIPGAGLDADPEAGLKKLTDNISDIKLFFLTYSHQGQ